MKNSRQMKHALKRNLRIERKRLANMNSKEEPVMIAAPPKQGNNKK